jgi:SNF2 family DNA or RNA helicase
VVKGTIEEKIVKLHAHKRDLADGLLEGTNAGARLSMDDLVDLISEV